MKRCRSTPALSTGRVTERDHCEAIWRLANGETLEDGSAGDAADWSVENFDLMAWTPGLAARLERFRAHLPGAEPFGEILRRANGEDLTADEPDGKADLRNENSALAARKEYDQLRADLLALEAGAPWMRLGHAERVLLRARLQDLAGILQESDPSQKRECES